MTRHNQAAIRHGVQKGFAPIEAGVQAHRIPEIPRTIEREREKETDQNNAACTNPALPGIAQVRRAKCQRKQERGGPETDPVSQRELRVATKQKLLEKPHQRKNEQVEQTPAKDAFGCQCQTAKGIAAKR